MERDLHDSAATLDSKQVVAGRQTAYSVELRVLACAQCGAPVQGAATGGLIPCGYCGATNELTARRDEAVRSTSTLSEAVRIERLRQQDGRRLAAPPGLDALLEDGIIPSSRMAQAKQQWLRERRGLQLSGTIAAAERFYFLTNAQLEFLVRSGRDQDLRCVIETALEHLTDERHQQVLHAELAQLAARAGDAEAAARWLSLCTSHADDLHMDSAYRAAQACLATLKGDWRAVLQVLGMQAIDVPIADERDDLCAVLRANALERSGMRDQAVAELMPLALAEQLAPLLQRHSALQVCPESGPAALAQASELLQHAVEVRSRDDAVGEKVLYFLGALAVVVAATAAFVLIADLEGHIIVLVAVLGFIVTIVAGGIWNHAIFQARLDRTSRRGQARVLSAELVGEGTMAVRLLVRVEGQPGFVAHLKTNPTDQARSRLVVGHALPVDVPHDSTFLQVRWDTSQT